MLYLPSVNPCNPIQQNEFTVKNGYNRIHKLIGRNNGGSSSHYIDKCCIGLHRVMKFNLSNEDAMFNVGYYTIMTVEYMCCYFVIEFVTELLILVVIFSFQNLKEDL